MTLGCACSGPTTDTCRSTKATWTNNATCLKTMTSEGSSTSTTPHILTPESTGTSPERNEAAAAVKKARRQTAFYPNMNAGNKAQKPFSRSAAKRESVMALGSIEHLQYYFTKTGIAAKKKCVFIVYRACPC